MKTFMPDRLAWNLGAGMLLCVAALALGAAQAEAATYHSYLCRVPYGPDAGKPAPTDSMAFTPYGGNTLATQNCSAGGAMTTALNGGAHAVNDKALAVFTAPGGMTVAGFRVWRQTGIGTNPPPSGEGISNLAYTNVLIVDNCAPSAGCTVRGNLDNPLAPENEVAVANLSGVTQVSWGVGCRTAACTATGKALSAVYNVLAADMLLDDPAPPTAAGVGGPLLAGGRLVGSQSVSFNAADTGSGVHKGTITVDGAVAVDQVLDANGGGCADMGVSADGRPSYLNTQPCPATVAGLLTLNTDALTPGSHTIAVYVADAAGNQTVINTSTIDVVGSVPPGTPNGSPATRGAKLTARFSSTKKSVRRLSYRSRATITGRLVAEAGQPITGAAVDLLVRDRRRGARSTRIATTTTDATGAFRVLLPSGPSRTVTIQYTAFTGDPKPAAQRRLTTSVRASLTASVRPRAPRVGQAMRISGRLKFPPRGRVDVAMQARDGRVWRTVDTVRTKTDGRFTWTYRFRAPNSAGRRFQFRARVASQVYPFAPTASRPIGVRVRR